LKDLQHNPDISSHRAFVYSACAPGSGEFYAGSRLRGAMTATLFIILTVWLMLNLYAVLQTVVGGVFDSLNNMDPLAVPDLPLVSLVASFLGVYFLWLWAAIAAVDAAVSHRHKHNGQLQVSVAWAATMSLFCPGSGQVYTAERRFGYMLFAAYLLGIMLTIPAYRQLIEELSGMTKSGQLSTNNPYAVINVVHGFMARLDYSFGNLLQSSVRYFALAATLAALSQGPLNSETCWTRASVIYGLALLGLGWLCPGSGQILQQRNRWGWYLLAGYLGSVLLIGFLLGHDLITVSTADSLAWISVIIQWTAMLEAPIRMFKGNDGK
jgi:hypothetical protein